MASVDNFTNDSARMIAWERHLESQREDALFQDPFAKPLAGTKGENLSAKFGLNCTMFEFVDWPEFHKQWTAVRTRFIDDRIREYAASGNIQQIVNLGAGMDTRVHRLECYKAFTKGSYEVDMAVVNENKLTIFEEFLGTPPAHTKKHIINLDFKEEEKTLSTELSKESSGCFDSTAPALFVSEGLIMYLGAEGKLKFIKDVSLAAAPGSVLVLQFMDGSDTDTAKGMLKANPRALDGALTVAEAERELTEHGW
jgi:methyltransferase (TIGR00027 family)